MAQRGDTTTLKGSYKQGDDVLSKEKELHDGQQINIHSGSKERV
jgi:hypothetical protein